MRNLNLNVLLVLTAFVLGLLLPFQQQAFANPDTPAWNVWQLAIDGPVGPATSDYIRRNIDKAEASGAKMIILRIDTPGGLDTSMREIIKKIIASPLPIVGNYTGETATSLFSLVEMLKLIYREY